MQVICPRFGWVPRTADDLDVMATIKGSGADGMNAYLSPDDAGKCAHLLRTNAVSSAAATEAGILLHFPAFTFSFSFVYSGFLLFASTACFFSFPFSSLFHLMGLAAGCIAGRFVSVSDSRRNTARPP